VKIATNAGAKQSVERQHRGVRPIRGEALNQRIQRHHGRAETEAERACRAAQQGKRRRSADQQRAGGEQRHGEQVGAEAEQQQATHSQALGQPWSEGGGEYGERDLRNEHRAVLRAGQMKAGRADEDGAGGGKGHQRQALHCATKVQQAQSRSASGRRSGGCAAQPRRWSR
jgi:hypothetical protein